MLFFHNLILMLVFFLLFLLPHLFVYDILFLQLSFLHYYILLLLFLICNYFPSFFCNFQNFLHHLFLQLLIHLLFPFYILYFLLTLILFFYLVVLALLVLNFLSHHGIHASLVHFLRFENSFRYFFLIYAFFSH